MQFFVILVYLAVFILVYKITDGWFSVARLHTLMWFILFLCYVIFGGKELFYYSIFWLMASCLALTAGEKIGKRILKHSIKSKSYTKVKFANTINERAVKVKLPSFNWTVLIIFILLGLLSSYLLLTSHGYDLSVFFDPKKFIEMNEAIAYDRYFGENKSSAIVVFLSIFTYTSALCGGYSFLYADKKRKKILCILALLPVIFNMMINNTKAGFIASVLFWAIGFITAYLSIHRHSIKLKPKIVLLIITLVVVLILVLMTVMCVRIGDFSPGTIEIVKNKFITYAFGQIEAFDLWLAEYWEPFNYEFGKNTFMIFFRLFGLVVREQGVYPFLPNLDTNVFTGYRGVITDFGLLGGLIFLIILGIVSGISYHVIKHGHTSIIAKIAYTTVLFFIFHSYIISPWVYTTYCLTFVVFFFYLWIASQKSNSIKRRNYGKKHIR